MYMYVYLPPVMPSLMQHARSQDKTPIQTAIQDSR